MYEKGGGHGTYLYTMHFKTPNESGNDTQQYCFCISYVFCCCLLICPLLSMFSRVFDIFWLCNYWVLFFSGQCPCLTKNVNINQLFEEPILSKQKCWYFFWRLDMNTLLMEPCETVPKIGNVWERGGTWHNGITIHHAFQNAKRIRKWYSTVLLLYFLRILLLSSYLPFAFCVFLMLFDIFWFRYTCILSVLWPMSHVWQNVNINVLKKRNKKRAAIFKTGNVWERRVKWNRSFSLFFCSFVFFNIFLGTLMDVNNCPFGTFLSIGRNFWDSAGNFEKKYGRKSAGQGRKSAGKGRNSAGNGRNYPELQSQQKDVS